MATTTTRRPTTRKLKPADQLDVLLSTANSKAARLSADAMKAVAHPNIVERLGEGRAQMRKDYPDLEWKIDKVVSKRDRIAFRYTASGTQGGSRRKATWCGTGVAFLDKRGLIQHLSIQEDHWGRLVDHGLVPKTPEDDASGNWKGSLWGVDFALVLSQSDGSSKVTGTISGLGQSLPVNGTNVPPNVSFSAKSPKGTVTFVGLWKSANSIAGTLNGVGFKNQPVTFNRG